MTVHRVSAVVATVDGGNSALVHLAVTSNLPPAALMSVYFDDHSPVVNVPAGQATDVVHQYAKAGKYTPVVTTRGSLSVRAAPVTIGQGAMDPPFRMGVPTPPPEPEPDPEPEA